MAEEQKKKKKKDPDIEEEIEEDEDRESEESEENKELSERLRKDDIGGVLADLDVKNTEQIPDEFRQKEGQ